MQHLTTKQLAERENVSPYTIRKWRMIGAGPTFLRTGNTRLKGRCIYALSDVEIWERSRKARSTSEEASRPFGSTETTAARP